MTRMRLAWLAWLIVLLFPFAFLSFAGSAPRLLYGCSLSGDLWKNQVNSSFQFDDDFHLSSLNMNVSGSLLRTKLGDVTANWNDLAFAHRSFRGLEVELPVSKLSKLSKLEMSLLGGSVALPDVPDLMGPQRNSAVYGVRAGLPLGSRFRIGASQLFTPGTSADRSLNNLVLSYQPAIHQRLSLELARSHRGAG